MGNDAPGGGSQSQPPTSRPDRPPPGISIFAGESGGKAALPPRLEGSKNRKEMPLLYGFQGS
jgi:hypothetical protein